MKKGTARSARKDATFEVDIKDEFRDVHTTLDKLGDKLDDLRGEINGWKSVFETQLSRLNDNMDKALSTIADHEARLTEIEKQAIANKTKAQTVGEMAKFMWFVAKALVGAGIGIGALLGSAQAWKILFPA